MKTRDSWIKVLGVAGVTVLACGLCLLASHRGSGRRDHEAGAGVSLAGRSGASDLARTKHTRWAEAYGQLPLSFEENVGQTAQEVRYVSHGAGYKLFLTSQEAVLALHAPVSYDLSPLHRFATMRALRNASRARAASMVRVRFEGANPDAHISATDQLLKKTNYFIGSDRQNWRTGVLSYGRVRYADIYPGVDLVFYGNQRKLEYDFVVAPGADPKLIRLNLQGARRLRINRDGDVVLSVAGGEVVLQKPVVYQMVKGERHEIAGGYVLAKGHRVTFSVPSYDQSEPLILDPVLNYSTYLGGTSDDQGFGIAIDAAGNAFVGGATTSTDFPTTATGFDPGPLGSNPIGAVFVTEMNPSGTAELYSTYIAGNSGEICAALALDPAGKVYITGTTLSSDFPTTSNALKQSPNAANLNFGTSFISKLDPTLSGVASLVYSSYIGGTGGAFLDFGNAIAADASGNAYVAGDTFSSPGNGQADFPVQNALQPTPTDIADGTGFLTRIDTTQTGAASLIYSTYLGGSGTHAANLGFADAAFGVAVDASSNAYLVGTTSSTDFPTTTSGFRTTFPTGNPKGAVFLTKIDTTKSGAASLVYSTFLGGAISDFGTAIGLGPSNVAYVTGTTSSTDFPTFPAGAFQTNNAAVSVAFVSLVDTAVSGASSLKYSTFLGGTSSGTGLAIRADGTGNAYVAGSTSSGDFPVTPGALQPVYPGANAVGFISKINPAGGGSSDLVYSTFFGGSGNGSGQEQAFGIAVDAATPPNAYITGQTFSTAATFPVFPAGAFQTTLKGTSDAFIAKLTLIPTLVVSPTSLNFGTILIPNTSAPQSVTLTNNTNAAIAFTSAVISGGSPAAANADYAISANTCGASIAAGASCTVSVTFKPTVVGAETANLVLTDADSTSPQTIPLTGAGTNIAPDFTVTGPATATVKDGAQVQFTVNVNPVGGFTSQVDLTCASVPDLTLGTCAASPASVTPDGVNPSPSTVTVTTTALMAPPPSLRTPPFSIRQVVPLILVLMLLCLLPGTRRLRMRLAMATAMIFFIVLAGCSGPIKPHTPTGAYTLTITGTLHGTATTHTATVNLTVN